MIGYAFEDDPRRCQRCACFIADRADSDLSMRCPICDRSIADATQLLSRIGVSQFILDLIPESVARENNILPFDCSDGDISILADILQPSSVDAIAKIRFILNRKILCIHAEAVSIQAAIERGYKSI